MRCVFSFTTCHLFGRRTFVLGNYSWKHASGLKRLLSNQVLRRKHVNLQPSGYGMLLSNPSNENRELRKFLVSSPEVKRCSSVVSRWHRFNDHDRRIISRKIPRLTATWGTLLPGWDGGERVLSRVQSDQVICACSEDPGLRWMKLTIQHTWNRHEKRKVVTCHESWNDRIVYYKTESSVKPRSLEGNKLQRVLLFFYSYRWYKNKGRTCDSTIE